MKKKNHNPEDSARLRQKAEELILSQKSIISNIVSETDILKLIHELEVHQFELEMQNEELAIAKEKAELAEAKYAELYDFAPSGYFTLSRNGSILEMNLRGALMLGRERSLLINSQFVFFIKEESRIIFANFLEEVFQGKSHVNCDLPLVSTDDNSFHIHLTGILSGTKEECRITAVDITERKIAEDDLRKNLAKYKVLIDTFPIAITISDPEGKIIETNEKALKLLGLSREEHLRRKLKGEEWTIIKPDGTVFPQEEYASVKALKENRLVENVEMGIVKSEEETTWLNVTAAPIPIEDFGVVIAYSDITPRKKVEQELTKAKDLFEKSEIQARDILQTAMDGFWMVNSEGCIVNVNQVACAMLGYSREEMLTMRIADVDSEETSEHTQNRIQKIVETGEDRFETKHRCKDGKIIDVEVSVKSQPSENFVVFISNITERKQAEKALKNRENLLNKVFDLLPVGLWFADANGNIIRGNPAGVKIWGAEPTVPIEEYGIFKARLHPSGAEIGPDDWALAHTIREGVTVADEQLEIDAFDGQKKIILNYTAPVLDEQGKIQGAIIVNEDITQRISAEQALLKSEEKYRQLIENSQDIIYTFSNEGVFMYVSPAWESLLGYKETEALGKSFHKIVHPDDLPACMEFFQKVVTTNQRLEGIEYRIQHANGTWLWHTSSAVPLRDETGNIIGYEGIARDITKRKQAEEALLKSESEFRLLAEAMPQIVWITRPDGWNVFFNQQWVAYTGLTLEESYGHGWNKPFHPDDQQRAWDAWQNATTNMATYSLECRLRRYDGEYKWWLVRGVPVLGADGAVLKWFGTCTDIDDIKCSEAELIEIKEKVEERETYLRSVLQSNNDIIVSRDLNNNVVFFNKAFDDITMELFNQRAFAGMNTLNLLPAEEGEHWKNVLEKVKNGVANEEEYGYTTLFKSADYLTSHFPVIQGSKVVGTLEVTKDITLFKNRENELKIAKDNAEESEEKYKALFYNAPLSYQSLDENGCFIDINPMWLKTLGYERSEVIGKWYGDFLHPDFVEHFRINFPAFKKRGYVSGVQFKMRRKDTTCIDVSFEGCVGYTPEGKFKQTYCVFKDITEQKALENELAESVERYKSLHNASFGGIAIHDKGVILECNQGLSEMTGYSLKELIGMDGLLLIAPQHREMVMNEIITGNDKPYEAIGIQKNGKQFPMRLEARNIPYKGKNVRSVEFRDITESKTAEEEIIKTGMHYQALIEKAPDGIALIDAGGKFKYISPSAKRMFGYNLTDEITGHPNDYTHPDDLPFVLSELEKVFKDPTYITTIEYRFIDKHGNWHWIETTFSNLLANPSVESIILNFRDITERKLSEKAISLSEEKFRKAFITSPDSININRLEDGMYISINKGFTQIAGYTEEEVQGKTSIEINIWATDDERKKVNDELKSKGYVENLEVKFRKKDGKPVDGLMSASIIELEGVPHILSITRDITERKQAETKLHQSEERYALVIEASEQGIWDWNVETNEVFYSGQWKKQIGYKDDELKNEFDTWVDHLHPDEKEYCLNAVNSYLNHPIEHFILDFRFRHKDGSYRWIHNKAASIKNEEGKVIRLFGTHTDYTESKLSEAIFKDIIEKNPMSIQILDMEGYPVQVNPAHTKLFGVEPPAGYSVFKDNQLLSLGFGKLFERIKKGEVVFLPDTYYNVHEVDPSFPDFPVWVRALGFTLNDNNGNPSKIVLMHENITDRKNAEALLNDIIENNPMSIQIVDKEGHTLRGNPAFVQLFGSVPPPEFSIFEDLKSKSIELENLVARVKNGDIVHLPDIYFNAHDAHIEAPDIPLWIRALIFPLKDSAGKPGRFVFMHENITERKLYEAEIHTLNEQLEQRVIDRTAQLEAANKELEAFSYSVSHDLRTPLRALNGFATILTEDYSIVLDDEGKRLLAVISENATKMGCLIDDLLSFSRLGRVEMVLSTIQMKTLAASVFNELVPEKDRDKIRFTLGNIPVTLGDPSMVKQVWVNLIGNAIKFTSKKTDRHIEIGVITGENENIYFVKDNGAGFEMAKATKLFSVFQRLHTLKEFDGTGAGLAIVRRIILRHNGLVWAEGKVNEGATFYFSLPLLK